MWCDSPVGLLRTCREKLLPFNLREKTSMLRRGRPVVQKLQCKLSAQLSKLVKGFYNQQHKRTCWSFLMLPSMLVDMSLKAACSAPMASASLAAAAELPRALAAIVESNLCMAAFKASTSVWSAFPSTTVDTFQHFFKDPATSKNKRWARKCDFSRMRPYVGPINRCSCLPCTRRQQPRNSDKISYHDSRCWQPGPAPRAPTPSPSS